MDYKELVENLKEWHRTICKTCGDDILTCDDLCGCTGDCIVVQAITAITDLLTENQALRNAANGFKKQVETAEKKAEKAERERDIYLEWLNTVRPCQFCHHILPDPTPECEECGRCRTKYKPKFVLRDLDKE